MTYQYTLAIVDDNKERLTYIKSQLDNYFNNTVNIKVFTDPIVALQQFIDPNGFDLILLDCLMPSMNGKDVYRELRLSKKQTPVAFYSADATVLEEVNGIPDTKNFLIDLDNPYSIQRIAEYATKTMDDYMWKNNVIRLHDRLDTLEDVQKRSFNKVFATLDTITNEYKAQRTICTEQRAKCPVNNTTTTKTGWGKFGEAINNFFSDPVTKILGSVVLVLLVTILPKIYQIIASTGGAK